MNEQTNPEPLQDDEPRDEAPADTIQPSIDLEQVKRVLEAALLSSTEPLTVLQLKRLFAGEVDADNIRKVLDELKGEWAARSIELTTVASGWRFRVKPDYQKFLDRISSEKPRPGSAGSGSIWNGPLWTPRRARSGIWRRFWPSSRPMCC